tara:strand:+ start:1063 stop:1260 length:198 start_codon:yes stop_codon:yes gene_type:complete
MGKQNEKGEIDLAEEFGQGTINTLFLKSLPRKGKGIDFETVYGPKTNIGTGRTIIQVLKENQDGK